jgi:hypothetical protein
MFCFSSVPYICIKKEILTGSECLLLKLEAFKLFLQPKGQRLNSFQSAQGILGSKTKDMNGVPRFRWIRCKSCGHDSQSDSEVIHTEEATLIESDIL